MKMPWHNQTGLAKAAIICATGLGISTGLCGLNAALSSHAGDASGFLIFTGFLELWAMVAFAASLLIVAVLVIFKVIVGVFSSHKPEGEQ